MNRRSFRFLTFIISVLVSGTSLFVMPVSAEEISLVPQKAQYEVDNKEYRAKIDEFYGYIPLDELVVASLNKVVDSYNTFFTPYQHKWFYKHVLLSRPELEISIHESDKDMPDSIPFSADSLGLMAEQGRGDNIEEEDGKVRKFNDIDVYWNIVVSERKQDEQAVNQFLTESGYNISAVHDEKDAKKFYLQIDEKITADEILTIVLALYKKFGFLPKTYTYEKGIYTLYHDLDYIGMTTSHTLKAGEYDTTVREQRIKNNGVFESGVEYHFNPETKVLLIDGNGILYQNDIQKIVATFWGYRIEKTAEICIIGKDVKLENGDGKFIDLEYNQSITTLVPSLPLGYYSCFTYKDSYADSEYKKMMQYFIDRDGKENVPSRCIYYLDDCIDANDVLNGTIKLDKDSCDSLILPMEDDSTETTEKPSKSANPDLGDADLNGEVSLSDITAIAKYNLSHELYPLANDTAMRNADMNEDGIVNTIDVSVLIERQLGK